MKPRQIVHLNIAGFMAAIEEADDLCLRDRPVIIAPASAPRAVVWDMSARAYREGIRRGMPLPLALRRVPGAVLRSPRPHLYAKVDDLVYRLACEYSPVVEQASRGNLFVDIAGTGRMLGPPVDAAARLKRELLQRMSLDPTTGLAANKLVCKVATRVVKPHGFVSVRDGDEGHFMAPQEIALLPGIGERLQGRLHLLAVDSIGTLAGFSNEQAVVALGGQGIVLRDHARGEDHAPLHNGSILQPVFHAERLLTSDDNDTEALAGHLRLLAEDIGLRLRRQNLSAARFVLVVRYTDSLERQRQITLKHPVHLDADIVATLRPLLQTALDRRVRVRSLSLSVSRLTREHRQLDLFMPPEELRGGAIQQAMDAIRGKFGSASIGYGNTLALQAGTP